MLSTNTRWVQSTNISVDVANYGQIKKNSHCTFTFCLLQKMTCLDWTIYSWLDFSFWGCFFMLRTNCSCVQSPNKCRCSQIGENYPNTPSTLRFWLLQEMTSLSCNNQNVVRFQHIRMSSYAMNKLQIVQSTNISVGRQMWIKFSSTLMLGDWTHLQFVLSIKKHPQKLKSNHE